MQKRLLIALGVLLVAVVCALVLQEVRGRVPVYKGKSVVAWIAEGYMWTTSSPEQQAAANKAVSAVGTNALPYYLELLESKGDSHLKMRMLRFLQHQQWLKLNLMPWSSYHRRAIGWTGIELLGADAKPVIPTLTKLLKYGDEDQVGRAASALAEIGFEGIQPLTNALADLKAGNARCASARALGRYAQAKNPWGQKDRPLGEVDAAARVIVPILIPYLHDGDSNVQVIAMQSLGYFAREPQLVVPMLAALVQSTNGDMRTRYIATVALQEYGDKAKAAVPALVQALQDPDPNVRIEAADALRKIDPEAAARAGVK